MSSRNAIERMIEKAEEEQAALRKQIELKDAYIQGLKDTVRHFPKSQEKPNGQTALRAGSDIAKAREIILKEGKPMHIAEIIKRLGKEVTKQNKASLSSYIGSFVRNGEHFTRPAPNTFGIVEFEENLGAGEPPQDFGKE
jgi:intergrase/recombinase